jgi:hypothetical protein
MASQPIVVDPSQLSAPVVANSDELNKPPQDSLLDKIGHGIEDVIYPGIGAVAGLALGGAGGAETGPGAILTGGAGAALGAGIGTELKRGARAARGRSDLNPTGWGHVAETGTDIISGPVQESKALKAAMPAIEEDLSKVSPRVAKLMNDYLGLHMNDLPKYERMRPGTAAEVGSTIYKEAGMASNLNKQKALIDQAIKDKVAANDSVFKLLPPAATSDVHHTILNAGANLLDELASTPGITEENLNSAGRLVDDFLQRNGKDMTPQQMLEMRRNIGKDIRNWNPNTANAKERFNQMLYHDLNDQMMGHLSPEDADKFMRNNRTINRLIIGSQAAGEKLNKGDLKSGTLARALTGAVVGGATGAASGHMGLGAAVGGVGGAALEHIPEGVLKKAEVEGTRLAGKAAKSGTTAATLGRIIRSAGQLPEDNQDQQQ